MYTPYNVAIIALSRTPVVKQEGLAKKVETEIKQPEKKKIKKEDSDDDEPLVCADYVSKRWLDYFGIFYKPHI